MTGYAAFGPVERGRVSPQQGRGAVSAPVLDDDDRVIELPAGIPSPGASRIHGVLTAAREQWALTTFSLFDANSWR